MKTLRIGFNLLAVAVLTLTFISVASATVMPSRTWVANSGADGNVCSHFAPCATFSGALAKTAAGGEINCVDSGDYGTVLIQKAITIDCAGSPGSILVGSGFFGITVNAGLSDVITIRNVSINGGGNTSTGGIGYTAAGALHLENVHVSNIAGFCVDLSASASALLTVDDSTISDCGLSGIKVNTSSGTAAANINNTRISKTGIGIQADNGSRITITKSTVYFNNNGVAQNAGAGGSTVTAVGCTFGYSSVAALQSHSSPNFILAFGNNFVNDVLVFNPNGGSIFTGSDNNNSGSTAGTANGGSLPKI